MRRQQAFKEKHKQRLVCKVQGRPFIRQTRAYKNCVRDKIVDKKIPANFEVLNNQNEVFQFVYELLDMHSNRKLKHIKLDLTDVQTIDAAAICLLLSVVSELGNCGIKVSGNYPINIECAKVFIESGFLNHMKNEQGYNISIETSEPDC